MFTRKKKRVQPTRLSKENTLTDNEMKKTMGSGNGQVRYVADEFIQSRILKERGKL